MRDPDDDPRDDFIDLDLARDDAEDAERGERYGFGVCRRGNCDEPCGPNGGCVR